MASGEWTDEEPTCQLIHCQPLPAQLQHGTVTPPESTSYGSTAQFSCNPGYELRGPEQVTCQANKRWSGPFPSCLPIQCPYPGIIPHGGISHNKADEELEPELYHLGDSIDYFCHAGFALEGDGNRKCLQDGSWSGQVPQCFKVTCPDAPIPKNGYTLRPIQPSSNAEERPAIPGQTVQFGCKVGFQLEGPSGSKCLETGKWDVDQPSGCLPVRCSHPPTINNGRNDAVHDEFIYSDVVVYECHPGFRLKANNMLICSSSGEWEGQVRLDQRVQHPTLIVVIELTSVTIFADANMSTSCVSITSCAGTRRNSGRVSAGRIQAPGFFELLLSTRIRSGGQC